MQTVTDNSNSGQKSNASYNGYELQLHPKLSPTEKKIVAVLERNAKEISPEQIKAEIEDLYHLKDVSSGTIRPLLRNLTKRGVIYNPWKGLYCDKLTYDVRVKPIAVHNIRLHCDVVEDLESWETTVEVGGAEIHVVFGSERNKISGWIKYDRGMDRAACMLAIDKWSSIAETRLGHPLGAFELTRLEVNRDDLGGCLDGSVHCATREIFKEAIIERVYEKEDCLRQEYCVRKNLTPQQLEQSLFVKGIDNFLVSVAGHEQDRKLSGIEKTQRVINSKLQDIDASNRAIQKKLVSGASSEDSAHALILELAAENRRAMAFMSKKYGEAMALLSAKTVETEELKRMVLSISKSAAEVVDALSKARQPEPIHGNEQNKEAMKEYVQ